MKAPSASRKRPRPTHTPLPPSPYRAVAMRAVRSTYERREWLVTRRWGRLDSPFPWLSMFSRPQRLGGGRGSGSGQSLCLTHTPPSHGHACVPEGELLLCNGVAQGVCLGESQSSGLRRTVRQLLSFRASWQVVGREKRKRERERERERESKSETSAPYIKNVCTSAPFFFTAHDGRKKTLSYYKDWLVEASQGRGK